MSLNNQLLQKKDAILRKWLCMIYEPFGPSVSLPRAEDGDRFTDPVGYTISRNAAFILNALIQGDDPETSRVYLERIIKIRAVQDLTPAQATSFMSDLKTVIRSQVTNQTMKLQPAEEVSELDKRIDRLGHIADEIYIEKKRQIRELAIKHTKKDNNFRARITGTRGI
ncbi:MAG: RsbRD N-terminal domain-containing protein [Dehalococcoidia bacterium]